MAEKSGSNGSGSGEPRETVLDIIERNTGDAPSVSLPEQGSGAGSSPIALEPSMEVRFSSRVPHGGGGSTGTLAHAMAAIESGLADVVVGWRAMNERSEARFGVAQMTLGICCSLVNCLHWGDKKSLYFGFIPEIVFFLGIFGYLVVLILAKWATDCACGPRAPEPICAQKRGVSPAALRSHL